MNKYLFLYTLPLLVTAAKWLFPHDTCLKTMFGASINVGKTRFEVAGKPLLATKDPP